MSEFVLAELRAIFASRVLARVINSNRFSHSWHTQEATEITLNKRFAYFPHRSTVIVIAFTFVTPSFRPADTLLFRGAKICHGYIAIDLYW